MMIYTKPKQTLPAELKKSCQNKKVPLDYGFYLNAFEGAIPQKHQLFSKNEKKTKKLSLEFYTALFNSNLPILHLIIDRSIFARSCSIAFRNDVRQLVTMYTNVKHQ